MDLHYLYAMKRNEMGKQPQYCMQTPQLLDSVPPDALEAKKYILRNPVNQPTQNAPCFSQHEVNTERVEFTDDGINHAEGGWPKDVNVNDPEATQRYRRRIEKDDIYISCVMKNATINAHLGPVWALHRNPSFLKNFLTVGDWTARVWSEDCRESAVLWTPPGRYSLTDGTWSPTRFSLMLLTQTNGMLTLWDLLKRQHEPVLSVQVCEEPLAKVAVHDAGALITCGSQRGTVYLLEMSTDLVTSGKHDKVLLTQVLERESKRERILEARQREIKLRQRKTEEVSPAASLTSVDAAAGDTDLDAAAADYTAVVKKELTFF